MDRRGFHLTEILVALAIAAGPMLVAVHLTIGNARATRFNTDRATARMILLDLASLLQGESARSLGGMLTPGREKLLTDLLNARIRRMPEPARAPYLEQAGSILGRVSGRLEERIDPAALGLARITLTASLPGERAVSVTFMNRPAARERLRVRPDPSGSRTGRGGTL